MSLRPGPGCFACAGDGPRPPRVRLLCAEHTAACRLADGDLLRAVLANAAPADAPLEGSLLGWLYNPVTVIDCTGTPRRGWTDFAAGGMGVWEDAFNHEQFFDLWLTARDEGSQLLRDISGLPPDAIQQLAGEAHGVRGEFVALAHSMWRSGMRIQARRAALGRWPVSYDELLQVLREAPKKLDSQAVRRDPEFTVYLASLAERYQRALPPE